MRDGRTELDPPLEKAEAAEAGAEMVPGNGGKEGKCDLRIIRQWAGGSWARDQQVLVAVMCARNLAGTVIDDLGAAQTTNRMARGGRAGSRWGQRMRLGTHIWVKVRSCLSFSRLNPENRGNRADQVAQKIKADLIERAKLKKNYAKVLKAEGMESGRLQDRSGARKSRTGGEDGNEVEGEGEGAGGGEQGAESRAPRSKFDRKGKGRATDDTQNNLAAEPPIPTAQRKRALSPSDIGAPMVLSELKILKEKAYAKSSRPTAGDRGRVAQGGSVRGSRGQPNMGARMGVLLEQIKAGRK